jgi:hypothetical protein
VLSCVPFRLGSSRGSPKSYYSAHFLLSYYRGSFLNFYCCIYFLVFSFSFILAFLSLILQFLFSSVPYIKGRLLLSSSALYFLLWVSKFGIACYHVSAPFVSSIFMSLYFAKLIIVLA